ncbi:extracellular solute-binding protein [Microbacterium sp. SYP-A9085]|jgi:iron(III) transport system substrate-binding protein|uniref:ABC transporter substrate-binding protein n=1 Tax=Microbacterium sp. SYP-A9085 TaxID=2664454 RepID=UPI00129B8E3F|nr:extracellular solute-binding protein [Microbacterium sp. SYP-A9085]MRH29051.1 extracellular solute-binding protein [Microbacterium sp. SYP-A9085]
MNRLSRSSHARRRWSTVAVASVAVAGLAVSLSACAGDAAPKAPENKISQGVWPSYYPSDYGSIVDAAKKEGGELTIYSNTDQENWAPIFRDFQKKYPFVTKISANNLDSDEVFQKQLSETATGNAPADILATNAVQAWAKYDDAPDRVLAYKSPELAKLPDFAQVMPNVYALSMDPVGLAYNEQLLGGNPTSIADLAKIVSADPAKFKNKITTRDVSGSFGFTVSKGFVDGDSDAWSQLAKILPSARPETSSGTQIDKITSGEYLAGFFISSAVAFPQETKAQGIFKFVFPKDGTVVLGRGIGITPKGPHPATAKLFLDFVLSEEGQNAVAEGGLTAYRDSVKQAEGLHTYGEIVSQAGEDAIIRVPYTITSDADVKAFTDKWNGMLGK